ncbi:signal peptidase I [Iamia majanohamensis]|uniref:Signal peptidase I n=1 Tax=Iamia majanohamensis TaxID=467976 RepID=A0AAE9Y8V4_9ACTN|nr:signal peptidase I [Iamia majanohamensis]WCO69215.1 signal peptidase I [Iamia majanohamensis]
MTAPDEPETPASASAPAPDPEGPDAVDDGAVEDDEDGPETPTEVRDRRVRSAVEWVAVLGGAVVVALLVRTFLFTTFWIPSGSMEPTLMGEGRRDRVIVNRLSYKLHDVNRGDIIVFEVPPGEPTLTIDGQQVQDLIKRVIGLPGETVELRDGDVYVDGELLDEPYLPDGVETEPICGGDGVYEVPDDSVFVMGDNRPMSQDARCWSTHSVEESAIVGRAFIRIWPLSEITLF